MDDELWDVYPRYIELICAIIRLARHDANGGYIDGYAILDERWERRWREDAAAFVAYIEGRDHGDSGSKSTVTVDQAGRRRHLDTPSIRPSRRIKR